ncbi:MAG: FHA domain-containing protein [Deltaproteobacteria bacterium]
MFCTACGCEIPDTSRFCMECGISMEESDMTKRLEGLGSTKIYFGAEDKNPPDFASTELYAESEMGRTVIFNAEEQRKPILGWIVPTEGKDAWRVFKLTVDDGQFVLGGAEECAIRLEDKSIDPRHASIRLKDGKIYITDLDSSSGTSINNAQISKAELHDGDEIKIGSATLKFRKL